MIERLFYLLSFIAEQVKKAFRRKEQREMQHDRDKLEESPADWYNDHFGGMRRNDAKEADETDPDSRRE